MTYIPFQETEEEKDFVKKYLLQYGEFFSKDKEWQAHIDKYIDSLVEGEVFDTVLEWAITKNRVINNPETILHMLMTID